MLVGVDATNILPGHGGGEEIYLRNVLKQMAQLERSVSFLVFTSLANHDSFDPMRRFEVASTSAMAAEAARAKIDVLFAPLGNPPVKTPGRTVLYSTGLAALRELDERRKVLQASPLKQAAARCLKASAIAAPSEFIRRELRDLLEAPLDKVVVAPLGVDPVYGEEHPSIVDGPYVLVVGRTTHSRNLARFIEASERVTQDIPHTIVLVGQPGEAERDDWGPRVVRFLALPKAHLAGLYRHCALCVCPSLYEGSGIVPLEAMRAGALLASGRVGGIAEVAGDVPVYFNPESVESMAGAMRRGLTEGKEERERRARVGKKMSLEYTWERCAAQTLAAFRRT